MFRLRPFFARFRPIFCPREPQDGDDVDQRVQRVQPPPAPQIAPPPAVPHQSLDVRIVELGPSTVEPPNVGVVVSFFRYVRLMTLILHPLSTFYAENYEADIRQLPLPARQRPRKKSSQ